jgi:hypothetical protein
VTYPIEEADLVYTSFGANATATIRTGRGRVKSAIAFNRNATVRYLQFYDTTSATTPVYLQFPVPGGGGVILDDVFFGKLGVKFANGIAYGFSTTAGSYVAATAGESDLVVRFV